jgi:diguanylate cyclase (GGDEF)-like protein
MEEKPKFERPTNLEEEHALTLERSSYMLEHIAHQDEQINTDPLTGVKNRIALEGELTLALKFVRGEMDAHRAGIEPIKEVSLIFIDLDNFGQVNKSIGHDAGDEVLKKAVEIIRGSVRETDTLGRFGGDEFLVLLPRANEEIARERGDRILTNLRSDVRLQELGVGASIGICSSVESTEPTALMHFADVASRKAKQTGKDRVEVYHNA